MPLIRISWFLVYCYGQHETRKTIAIATKNEGKLKEFRSILADAYDEILSLEDFDEIPDIEETGLSSGKCPYKGESNF